MNDSFDLLLDRLEETYSPEPNLPVRHPKADFRPKMTPEQIIASVAEPQALEAGFKTTYVPSRHEEGWLLDSLRTFYEQHLITDVLARVRGGKEANVYRCRAHPSTGLSLAAAKVYRPRRFRSLRNDALYRQGRPILTADGRPVKKTDHRAMRAIGKKTAFGVQVGHTSWLMHEHAMLAALCSAGAAVPQPLGAAENAILMGYVGDEQIAAPTLNEVALPEELVQPLFDEVIRNVEVMLARGVVHGDLSAYNILYRQGQITLIDFPQVTFCEGNPQARAIFDRDVERVCDYFAPYGVDCDAPALADELWLRHVGETPVELPPEEDEYW